MPQDKSDYNMRRGEGDGGGVALLAPSIGFQWKI